MAVSLQYNFSRIHRQFDECLMGGGPATRLKISFPMMGRRRETTTKVFQKSY